VCTENVDTNILLMQEARASKGVVLGSPARRIDHRGRRLRVEMADGAVTADAAIIALPSALLADETLSFEGCWPQNGPRPRFRFWRTPEAMTRSERSGHPVVHCRPGTRSRCPPDRQK
jgi:hypothetical protein